MISGTDELYDNYTYDSAEIDPEQKSMDCTRPVDQILSEEIRKAIEQALQGEIVPYEEVFGKQNTEN